MVSSAPSLNLSFPSISPNPRLQVSHAKRLNVLKAFFDQYTRIFEDHLPTQPHLPSSFALEDEAKLSLHEDWKESDYTRAAATKLLHLKRLKKLPFSSLQQLTYEELVPFFPFDMTLINHGFPTCDKAFTTMISSDSTDTTTGSNLNSFMVTCDRCHATLSVNQLKNPEHPCVYHWQECNDEGLYKCCLRSSSSSQSAGCCVGPHVYSVSSIAQLHRQFKYVVSAPTSTINTAPPPPYHSILILSTHEAYTTLGKEVVQVCVLSVNGDLFIQEQLVCPEGQLIDLNTRVTGIQTLDHAQLSLIKFQQQLLEHVNEDTIFIGHALQHSFNGLRLIHPTVIDTAILFPHPKGWPHQYSLQELSSMYLHSHTSETEVLTCFESAKLCLQLVRYFLQRSKLNLSNERSKV